MTTARELRDLSSLAVALCQDARITLEVRGRDWAWEASRRVLIVPSDAVASYGGEACAGIVAHEVGHAFLSRYLEFRELVEEDAWLERMAMNALEDPRVERWMMRRYPGVRVWLAATRGADDGSGVAWLPTMQLLTAFVREGWLLDEVEDAEVQAATCKRGYEAEVCVRLDATRSVRRDYVVDYLPSVELDATDPASEWHYGREVVPFQASTVARSRPSAREAWVQVLARRAYLTTKDSALGAVREQFAADVERLARGLAAAGLQGVTLTVLPQHLTGGRETIAYVQHLWSLADVHHRFSREQRDAAERILTNLLKQLFSESTTAPDVVLGDPQKTEAHRATPSRQGAIAPPRSAARAAYEDAYAEVAPDIDALVQQLEQVLRPQQRLGRRSGFASGQRVSMSKVMAFEADRRRPLDFWERSVAPTRRHAAFLLLVDLSGSMRGSKVRHAIAATALFAETLTRLQVPFSVIGFQDACIPVLDFSTPFDDAARTTVGSLVDEPMGQRTGGHNRPEANDDGPCLLAAAEGLLARREENRVLVVLSDGRPEGSHSGPEDLHRAVATLEPRLSLVGIGVGPGTEHVAEFYPHAVANVALSELAERVGDVLRDQLLNMAS